MNRRELLLGAMSAAAAGLTACGDAPPVFDAKYKNIVAGEIPGKIMRETGKSESFLVVTAEDATGKPAILGYGLFKERPFERKDGSKSYIFVRVEEGLKVNAGSITLDADLRSAKIEIVLDKENGVASTLNVSVFQTLTDARLAALQNASIQVAAKLTPKP